jgi:MSHA biogenesis protein MshP
MPLNNLNSIARQSAASLLILLFIIVAISLLSAALVRLNGQSAISNAQQVIATRAFYAAESAANFQSMRIFPLTGSSQCSDVVYSFTVAGLNGCVATTECSSTLVNGKNYYQVTSEGQCSVGQDFQATRTLQVRLHSPN